MKHLLDVNALVACEHRSSPHHAAFHAWAKREGMDSLNTCALAELGFVRVSMQAFGYTLEQAQAALTSIKKSLGGYVADAPSPRLAAWAGMAARTSDAYLMQVAEKHGLRLATFDSGIPGASLIR